MHSDAHIHPFDLFRHEAAIGEPALWEPSIDQVWCASTHEREEFLWVEGLARRFPGQVRLAFGVHPQDPALGDLGFLETLLGEGRLDAVGECGFDLFDAGFRSTLEGQKAAWDAQLGLAIDAAVPLVVHCRKALPLLFADAKRLRRARAVVFHGWPGSYREALAFLDRGVNAYYCVGKGLLRGDRSLRETASLMAADRLLTETDAPWMRSRSERLTVPGDIREVNAALAQLRGISDEECAGVSHANFMRAFGDGREARLER